MYLAQQKNEHDLPLYFAVFNTLAKGEKTSEKAQIDLVLKEAREILKGTKSIFGANNDYFHLLSFLISQTKISLDKIDPENIEKETYHKIALALEQEY